MISKTTKQITKSRKKYTVKKCAFGRGKPLIGHGKREIHVLYFFEHFKKNPDVKHEKYDEHVVLLHHKITKKIYREKVCIWPWKTVDWPWKT